MRTALGQDAAAEVVYPETDGLPLAENTLQFEWIIVIVGGLDELFLDRPDVFVAGDLFWYPVEGDPVTRTAPDAMVAIGRPKGHRRSYLQWAEGGIAPQVVFEVLSPGNRAGEMARKRLFYERYGVEEYYVYDPDANLLEGWLRESDVLAPIPAMDGWVSPRLGIRFDLSGERLAIVRPDGRAFATYVELAQRGDRLERERDELAHERDELAHERDELAHERDELARQRDEERERAERLAARLRAMGIDPAD